MNMLLMIKTLLFQTGTMAAPTELTVSKRRPFWLRPQLIVPALLLVFWYAGNFILGFILHLIHIVIELGEMGVEHLLEALLHVEGHTAQMFTAWTGLFVFIAFAKFLQILIRRYFIARFRTWHFFNLWFRGLFRQYWDTLVISLLVWLLSVFYF
jgi:hypothetical protein